MVSNLKKAARTGFIAVWLSIASALILSCGYDAGPEPDPDPEDEYATEDLPAYDVDDPDTANDESNDQPLGHFGTLTMEVASVESGNTYTLDVELSGTTVERIYFPKGGWVDFYSCDLDDGLSGFCLDEEGRSWDFGGESTWTTPSSRVWEEEEEEEDEQYWEERRREREEEERLWERQEKERLEEESLEERRLEEERREQQRLEEEEEDDPPRHEDIDLRSAKALLMPIRPWNRRHTNEDQRAVDVPVCT